LYGEGGDVRWIEKMESLEERISYVPSWKVAALDLRFVIDASTDPELRLYFDIVYFCCLDGEWEGGLGSCAGRVNRGVDAWRG
jgi:hypothetical protein